MIHSLLDSGTTDAIGWALVHFLWQGTVLALLLYIFVAFTRRAEVRYAAAVITLALMTIAPIATAYVLHSRQRVDSAPSQFQAVISTLGTVAGSAAGVPVSSAAHTLYSIDWTESCLCVWLAGVVVFGLRALGGYLVVQRVIRDRGESLSAELLARCGSLQQRLGLSMPVKYVRSRLVDVPAVVGWLRPIVLLPVAALTDLSPAQLEAVILHELAHIKRLDFLVNLFQTAVETLLFYHPAVWWTSRFIRQERENCCDDLAVNFSGDPAGYARALVSMEGWRGAPSLAVAATSGSLRSRVIRILGRDGIKAAPQSALALVFSLLIAGVVMSAASVEQALVPPPPAPATPTQAASAPEPPSPPAQPPKPAAALKIKATHPVVSPARAAAVDPPLPPDTNADSDRDDNEDAASGPAKSSYIEGLKAAGLKDMSVDELIAMKVQGVTPEYVQKVHSIWPHASIGDIMALKIQGVSPDYVRELKTAGFKDLSLEEILAAKIQGITPDFIRKVRAHGLTNLTLNQLIALKVTGVF